MKGARAKREVDWVGKEDLIAAKPFPISSCMNNGSSSSTTQTYSPSKQST